MTILKSSFKFKVILGLGLSLFLQACDEVESVHEANTYEYSTSVFMLNGVEYAGNISVTLYNNVSQIQLYAGNIIMNFLVEEVNDGKVDFTKGLNFFELSGQSGPFLTSIKNEYSGEFVLSDVDFDGRITASIDMQVYGEQDTLHIVSEDLNMYANANPYERYFEIIKTPNNSVDTVQEMVYACESYESHNNSESISLKPVLLSIPYLDLRIYDLYTKNWERGEISFYQSNLNRFTLTGQGSLSLSNGNAGKIVIEEVIPGSFQTEKIVSGYIVGDFENSQGPVNLEPIPFTKVIPIR